MSLPAIFQSIEPDDDEQERTLEENLFLLSQMTGRTYDALVKEHEERQTSDEFWSDPCWSGGN